MVLGIIGGAIAIIYGLFLVLGGAIFMNTSLLGNNYRTSERLRDVESESQYIQQATTAGIVFFSSGIGAVIAGALGLIGGSIVKNKNVAAGVMMIIAGGLSFLAFCNLVSMILLILGGVFALMKEPQNVMQPYPSQYPQPSPSPENPPQK